MYDIAKPSFISATLLQVFPVTFTASCCTVSTILPETSCTFCNFMHDFSHGPLSNSHGSVQHCHHDSSPSLSCIFCGFMLHCQHDPFPDPSCNFRCFVHDFSLGLSCSCHGFVLHCQHGSFQTFLIICLLFVSYRLIVCRVIQLLEYCTCSLSS